jgi:uncharacterized protein GlcG (DUF336 family)
MGLDIFFAEDIRNALMAADEASSSTARVCAAVSGDQVTLRAYLEGYRAALTTVALAFSFAPSVIAGRRETLEVETRTVGEILPAGGGTECQPARRAEPQR